MNTVGERIASRRRELRISAPELAKEMQKRGHLTIVRERVWDIEAGRRAVRAEEVPDLCRVLRTPLWWLLGMDKDEAGTLDVEWANQHE